MIRLMQETDITSVRALHLNQFTQDFDIENYIEGHPFNYGIVFEDSNEVVGYLLAQTIFENSDLFYITVSEVFKGRGLGSALMTYYLEACHQQNVENLSLEVRVSNHAALSLYKKYGYQQVTIRKNYYADGEDAVLMVKGLG